MESLAEQIYNPSKSYYKIDFNTSILSTPCGIFCRLASYVPIPHSKCLVLTVSKDNINCSENFLNLIDFYSKCKGKRYLPQMIAFFELNQENCIIFERVEEYYIIDNECPTLDGVQNSEEELLSGVYNSLMATSQIHFSAERLFSQNFIVYRQPETNDIIPLILNTTTGVSSENQAKNFLVFWRRALKYSSSNKEENKPEVISLLSQLQKSNSFKLDCDQLQHRFNTTSTTKIDLIDSENTSLSTLKHILDEESKVISRRGSSDAVKSDVKSPIGMSNFSPKITSTRISNAKKSSNFAGYANSTTKRIRISDGFCSRGLTPRKKRSIKQMNDKDSHSLTPKIKKVEIKKFSIFSPSSWLKALNCSNGNH